MPELYSSVWAPSPEHVIWKALERNHCTLVQESDIPGPVLRILTSPPIDCKVSKERRFFKVTNKLDSTRCSYMLLPDDTNKHNIVLSNSSWLSRHETSWEAVKHMSPEEVEKRVTTIILNHLKYRNQPPAHHIQTWFLGGVLNTDGLRGIDIAIEVFNWTALEYEDALAITARQLWNMYIRGEIRHLNDDYWILRTQHDVFLFVTGDTKGMNCYDRVYEDHPGSAKYPSRRRGRD